MRKAAAVTLSGGGGETEKKNRYLSAENKANWSFVWIGWSDERADPMQREKKQAGPALQSRVESTL